MNRVSACQYETFEVYRSVKNSINELRLADALFLLFDTHKNELNRWIEVKALLLRSCATHRDLSVVSALLECSQKSDVTQSAALIPGLKSSRIF